MNNVHQVLHRLRENKLCYLFPGHVLRKGVIQTLVKELLCEFRISEDIVSDQGAKITSQVWKEFFLGLGVNISLNYYLQSNSLTKRERWVIGRFLHSH